ncbi:hypothetical protein ACCI51_04720 [Microbulbifer echini]|uniref:DUF1700 domain-containing protein n=1 Tax=Microbulbifer echini TaxID=1529067 RepID=A0ABV4NKA1_9GAMM
MKIIEEYTIQELQEAIVGIDKEANPERYAEIKSEFSKKKIKVQELHHKILELSGANPIQRAASENVNSFTFKRCFLASCCSIGLLWLFLGVLGLLGLGTVTANGEQVHGVSALVTAALGGGLSCLIVAFSVWVGEKLLQVFENA